MIVQHLIFHDVQSIPYGKMETKKLNKIPYHWYLDFSNLENPEILEEKDSKSKKVYSIIIDTSAEYDYIPNAFSISEPIISFPNGGKIKLCRSNMSILPNLFENVILIGRKTILRLINDFGYQIGLHDEKIAEIEIKNNNLQNWQICDIDTGAGQGPIHIFFSKKFRHLFTNSNTMASVAATANGIEYVEVSQVTMEFKIDGKEEGEYQVTIALFPNSRFHIDIPIITTTFLDLIKKSIDAKIVCENNKQKYIDVR